MLRCFALVALLGLTAESAWAAAVPLEPKLVSVEVSPTTIDIRHHRQPHSLQVMGTTSEGFSLDLRAKARITSSNEKIATWTNGWVRPITSGEAIIAVNITSTCWSPNRTAGTGPGLSSRP